MKFDFFALIIFVVLVVGSCYSSSKNIAVRLNDSDINLFGYSDSVYNIGDELSLDDIDTSGLTIKLVHNKLESISINSNDKYELSNGIRIGSSEDEVVAKLGRPIEDEIGIMKGDEKVWGIPAYIYSNLIIFLDEKEEVEGILIAKTKFD